MPDPTTTTTTTDLAQTLRDLALRLEAEAGAAQARATDQARAECGAKAARAIEAATSAGVVLSPDAARTIAGAVAKIAAAEYPFAADDALSDVLRIVGDPDTIERWLALAGEDRFTHAEHRTGDWFAVATLPGLPQRPRGYRGPEIATDDPRISDALAKRTAEVVQRNETEKARRKTLESERERARETEEAERRLGLTMVVSLWGSDDQKAAHEEGLLKTAEIVGIIERALLSDPLDKIGVEHHPIRADVRARGERVSDVEQVSSAAFLTLRKIRDELKQGGVDVAIELERFTWQDSDGDGGKGYTALIRATWRHTTVERRAVLAID